MRKHFIITRHTYPKDYPEYSYRTDILNQLTAVSLELQTEKDFCWMVMTKHPEDVYVPKDVKTVFINPTTLNGTDLLPENISSIVSKHTNGSEWIATTRLDNDDLLHPDFSGMISKYISKAKQEIVIDVTAYRYHLHQRQLKTFGVYDTQVSSFATLIERNDNPKTVYQTGHLHLGKHYRVIKEKVPKYGVQVIHKDNAANVPLDKGKNIDLYWYPYIPPHKPFD